MKEEVNRNSEIELRESRGGRPGLPVPHSPCGLCGRKATVNLNFPFGTLLSSKLSCTEEALLIFPHLCTESTANESHAVSAVRKVCEEH